MMSGTRVSLVPTLRVGMQLPTLCVETIAVVGGSPTTQSAEDFIPTQSVGTRSKVSRTRMIADFVAD